MGNRSGWPWASGDDLGTRPGLAVGEGGELGVPRAADPLQVGGQLPIERLAPLGERGVLPFRDAQEGRRVHPVAPPVGPQVRREVLDAVEVVVGEDDVGRRGLCDPTQVADEPPGRLLRIGGGADAPRLARRDPAARPDRVQVAPVDASRIARLLEDRLLDRADAGPRKAGEPHVVPPDLLRGIVHRRLARVAVGDAHGVGLPVGRPHVPGQVGHGPREQVEVVRQGGRHEGQRDRHARAAETVDRAGRGYLGHSPLGQGGRASLPHQPVLLAVHDHPAVEPLGLAGPVARVHFSQLIRLGTRRRSRGRMPRGARRAGGGRPSGRRRDSPRRAGRR